MVQNHKYHPHDAVSATSIAHVQTSAVHDMPLLSIRTGIEPSRMPPKHHTGCENHVLPPTMAKDLCMFPAPNDPRDCLSSTSVESTPTLVEVPSGPRRDIQDMMADPLAETKQGAHKMRSLGSPDRFILVKTYVPQLLAAQPHVARLLVARDEYDRHLAKANFDDPESFDMWDARQIIDEDIADLVGKFIVSQRARDQESLRAEGSSACHIEPEAIPNEQTNSFGGSDETGVNVMALPDFTVRRAYRTNEELGVGVVSESRTIMQGRNFGDAWQNRRDGERAMLGLDGCGGFDPSSVPETTLADTADAVNEDFKAT